MGTPRCIEWKVFGQVIIKHVELGCAQANVRVTSGRDFWEALTDNNGIFQLTISCPEKAIIAITARAMAHATSVPLVIALTDRCDVGDLQIYVERAHSIYGLVTLIQSDREAISGATVSAQSLHEGYACAYAQTASDGTFGIGGLLPDLYHLVADKSGMLIDSGVLIKITNNDVSGVVLSVRKGASLSGRVEPPGPAHIGISMEMREGLEQISAHNLVRAAAQTDVNGCFVIRAVPTGKISINALTEDGRRGKTTLDVTTEDLANLVVYLEHAGSIHGRVMFANGEPATDRLVVPSRIGPEGIVHAGRELYTGVSTEADGEFRIPGLSPGKYRLAVVQDGTYINSSVEVEVSDPCATGVAIVIESQEFQIRGVVVDGNNVPALGSFVRATRVGTAGPQGDGVYGGHSECGSDGLFAISGIPAGVYEIVVWDIGFRRCASAYANTEEFVTVALPLVKHGIERR